MNRRDVVKAAMFAPAACLAQRKPLDLSEFEPKSMLQVKETRSSVLAFHLSTFTRICRGRSRAQKEFL